MAQIFLDESGNTGEDLLNADQPVFTLASLNCPEHECSKLKATYFSRLAATELKFSSLRKSRRQQEMVLSFLSDISSDSEIVRACVVHKRYALVAKMVDWVVEPAANAIGHDLRLRGENIALANLMFLVLPAFAGEEYVDGSLAKFQDMARLRDIKTVQSFFRSISIHSSNSHLERILDYLRLGEKAIDESLAFDGTLLDVTVSTAITLMANWRLTTDDGISLVHDASTQMAADRPL